MIDGARQYVRYSSVFGREAYDCVRNGGKEEGSRCRKSKSSIVLPAATTKQRGAIAVKGAWRPWTSGVDEERFHHRDVLVVDYDDEGAPICRSQKMLLVGMHVVFKSSLIDPHGPKNWLWTTFEHASNTPDCAEFSFQRPEYGFSHEPEILPRRPHPPASKREPVMLCRVTPIPTQTQMVNRAYEKALEVGGHGPWSHYRLVGAQWQVGRSPMPTNGVANTILEAYAQDPKHSKHASCMTCHNDLAARGDYIWTIAEYFFDSAPESTRWDRIKSLSRPEAD